MSDAVIRLGLSRPFIPRNLSVDRLTADRFGVLSADRIVERAPADRIVAAPRHPHARLPIGAAPDLGPGDRRPSAPRRRPCA